MKTLLLGILCLLFGRVTLAQLAPADEKAIREVITHFDANLNNHRFQDMTTYTTKDVSFITPIGMEWRGQQQVMQGHQSVFDAMHKGVPFKPSSMSIRSIAPGVAVVSETMSVGVSYPPDGVNRGTNKVGPGRSIATMTMVKQSGHWLVAAGQVTNINEQAIKGAPVKVAAVKTGQK
jgi:uncharacterized protein (TIGR02246 family)